MYSLEEAVEKLPPKVNFALLQPKFLVLGFSKKYDEGVELKDKTISKHMTMLTAKIISDVNILSVKGIYNAATPTWCVNGWFE
jgi:hypothetical protein